MLLVYLCVYLWAVVSLAIALLGRDTFGLPLTVAAVIAWPAMIPFAILIELNND